MREELSFFHGSLADLVAIIGAPWAPLLMPPPQSAQLPLLRRVWVSPNVAVSWPPEQPVAAMLIQGPLAAGSRVHANGVTCLRLTGTSPEDLESVQNIAPGVRELEISPIEFEEAGDMPWEGGELGNDDEPPPRIHIAPDPARFIGLQRLQARLDAQSLVILGPFVHKLPMLRRLGTLEVSPCQIAARCAWLPTGLEQCVLAVMVDDTETPHAKDTAAAVAALLEREEPKLDCRCLHVCFEDDAGMNVDLAFAVVANLNGSCPQQWPFCMGTMYISIRNPPMESTPLDRPAACE